MCGLFSRSDGRYGKWDIGNVWCVMIPYGEIGTRYPKSRSGRLGIRRGWTLLRDGRRTSVGLLW
jgi:hypothetical protein